MMGHSDTTHLSLFILGMASVLLCVRGDAMNVSLALLTLLNLTTLITISTPLHLTPHPCTYLYQHPQLTTPSIILSPYKQV
jgi:hypothetical protein